MSISILVALLLVLYPPRYTGSAYLFAGLASHGAAIGLELADGPIFTMGRIVSGHTLKHIAAAGGLACMVAMIRARMPCTDARTPPTKGLQRAAAGPTMGPRG